MDIDTDSLFGDHTKVRSFSDSEDDYADDPDPEARRPEQDQEPGANEGEAKKVEPAKVKRVIKNPQPKLDPQRLAGPRGMFHVQKVFKDVKWKGKGHEKEDLSVILKHLEHWAHRLYPKLPFQDTLEAIERLGMKKNVQIHMKKIRLDMVNEDGKTPEEEEDGILRGQEPEEVAPQVDIFDELIGENFSSGPPSAVSQVFPTPTAAPPASAPKPNPTPLTEEQKERLERNKRIAEEKRKARFLLQMEKKQAEANKAISTEDKAEEIVESEKGDSDIINDSSILESTELSLKQIEKSLEDSKMRESDNMEIEENKSDEQKEVESSSANASNITENSKAISKNESTDISLKENEESSQDSKRRESDNMEVDETESDRQNNVVSSTNVSTTENCNTLKDITNDSDKQKDVISSTLKDITDASGKNKGQTEMESENTSSNMNERTSDELSSKNIADSDSKSKEGICTEEEMLAMIDDDL